MLNSSLSLTERGIVTLMQRAMADRVTKATLRRLIAAVHRGDHLYVDRWAPPRQP